jgi:hypothetical protein
MTLCEFLHCSFSELSSRCPSLVDKTLLFQYLREKAEREEYAGKQPPPPKPRVRIR